MPSLAYIAHFLKAQFTTVPLPAPGHFAGQTIIVTGAGSGLGLEAVRHLTRLGAARIIVACRSVAKGEVAIADVEKSLAASAVPDGSSCTFEAWDVDLGSFASVAAFCERAGHDLDRVDAVVESAGVVMEERVEHEGHESTLTVNVLSTMLMALLMLPLLRRTAAKHNTRPRLVIVSSDAHFAVCLRHGFRFQHQLTARPSSPSETSPTSWPPSTRRPLTATATTYQSYSRSLLCARWPAYWMHTMCP